MSTLRTNTLSNAAGSASVPVDTVISGSAKAWVNFNGTGTVAIRQAFNVSSITDNGTGNYTVNLTNALVDANFSIAAIGQQSGGGGADFVTSINPNVNFTTSSATIRTSFGNGTLFDSVTTCVTFFR
jgi:hypothetical protein